MQALVLAGGEGTRLRPLTYTTPKAVMPLAGRPFLSFMLDWLHGHGVTDVVLSCGFLSEGVERVLGDIYQGMRLRYVVEDEPLGTAGPVRAGARRGHPGGPAGDHNGDVLTDVDLSAQLAWHAEREARATLALVAVEDTSSYGVVPTDAEGGWRPSTRRARARRSRTASTPACTCLSAACSSRSRAGRAVSFEREIFPGLADGSLFGYKADDPYWIDIGTPSRYLEATWDLLAGRPSSGLPARDETGSLILDGSLVAGAHVGPQSVLGPQLLGGHRRPGGSLGAP